MLADVAGAPGHRTRRKGVVGHRDSGRSGRGVFECPTTALADVLAGVAAAGGRGGGDLRTWQCGHADPHRRRDGRRRGGVGRPQRRSLQRKVPASVGGQHLLDPGGVRNRCRRSGFRRCGLRASGCWRRRSTARSASMTPICPGRRHGCSGPNPTACPPSWRRRRRDRVRIPMPGSAESLNVACGRGDLPVPERAGAATVTSRREINRVTPSGVRSSLSHPRSATAERQQSDNRAMSDRRVIV